MQGGGHTSFTGTQTAKTEKKQKHTREKHAILCLRCVVGGTVMQKSERRAVDVLVLCSCDGLKRSQQVRLWQCVCV